MLIPTRKSKCNRSRSITTTPRGRVIPTTPRGVHLSPRKQTPQSTSSPRFPYMASSPRGKASSRPRRGGRGRVQSDVDGYGERPSGATARDFFSTQKTTTKVQDLTRELEALKLANKQLKEERNRSQKKLAKETGMRLRANQEKFQMEQEISKFKRRMPETFKKLASLGIQISATNDMMTFLTTMFGVIAKLVSQITSHRGRKISCKKKGKTRPRSGSRASRATSPKKGSRNSSPGKGKKRRLSSAGRLQKLESENEELRHQCEGQQIQLDSNIMVTTQMRNRIKQLESQVAELEATEKASKREKTELEEEAKRLRAEIERITKEYNALKRKLGTKKAKRKGLTPKQLPLGPPKPKTRNHQSPKFPFGPLSLPEQTPSPEPPPEGIPACDSTSPVETAKSRSPGSKIPLMSPRVVGEMNTLQSSVRKMKQENGELREVVRTLHQALTSPVKGKPLLSPACVQIGANPTPRGVFYNSLLSKFLGGTSLI